MSSLPELSALRTAPLPAAARATRDTLLRDPREDAGVAYYLMWTSKDGGADRTTLRGGASIAPDDTHQSEKAFGVCIGIKRYGGLYCAACDVSLLTDGEEQARNAHRRHYARCPRCDARAPSAGTTAAVQSSDCSGTVVAPTTNDERSTVNHCSCFDWLVAPHRLRSANFRDLLVCDEYGNRSSMADFRRYVVDPCTLQFYDRIQA